MAIATTKTKYKTRTGTKHFVTKRYATKRRTGAYETLRYERLRVGERSSGMTLRCCHYENEKKMKMAGKNKKTKIGVIVSVLVFVIVLVILSECICRFVLGMCDAPLYQEDPDYEYILQPNQNRFRFFCHLRTNSYCQRSEEPDSTKKRVLGLGDSVIYGNVWVDQDSIATTLFSKETGIQMLNISCGSWGPDNCAAYLKKHGTFGASVLFLVCSSHDAYDVMTYGPVVGIYHRFPNRQYSIGLWELFDRYLIPYVETKTGALTLTKTKTKTKTGTYVDPDAQVEKKAANREVVQKGYLFNPGFDQLKQMADSCHIPLVIYLHAEQGELADGDYNDMGQDIIHWCDTAGVQLIRGIETERPDMYHDAIHFNEKGQRHLANEMKKLNFQ